MWITSFPRNSVLLENLFCCNPKSNEVIGTRFCTWHNSTAVVTCVKICTEPHVYNLITGHCNFHHVWIFRGISWLRCALDQVDCCRLDRSNCDAQTLQPEIAIVLEWLCCCTLASEASGCRRKTCIWALIQYKDDVLPVWEIPLWR